MQDFASVVGGLVLLVIACYGMFRGVTGIFAIFMLLAAFSDRGPEGEEWLLVSLFLAASIGSLLLLFVALVLLEPVVKFSFIPY